MSTRHFGSTKEAGNQLGLMNSKVKKMGDEDILKDKVQEVLENAKGKLYELKAMERKVNDAIAGK